MRAPLTIPVELLLLVDPDNITVDEVDYSNGGGWPTEADGTGPSIVLCDITADNSLAENWQAATTTTGVLSNSIEILGNPGAASQCGGGGPTISFVGSEITINENGGSVDIPIALENGMGTVSVSINAVAGSSTAMNVIDYVFSGESPSFAADAMTDTITITIPIVDDEITEDQETLVLQLTNPSAGATINQTADIYTINIIDNDVEIPNLVITEILYNSPDDTDDYEFIEIYNNGNQVVNMNGYSFVQGVNYTFPDASMQPGGILIVAKDSALIENTFEIAAFQWGAEEGLSNSGETIELQSPSGGLVNSVAYSNMAPWDSAADGQGPSLELCDVNSDNSDASNWQIAIASTGVEVDGIEIRATPGELKRSL